MLCPEAWLQQNSETHLRKAISKAQCWSLRIKLSATYPLMNDALVQQDQAMFLLLNEAKLLQLELGTVIVLQSHQWMPVSLFNSFWSLSKT